MTRDPTPRPAERPAVDKLVAAWQRLPLFAQHRIAALAVEHGCRDRLEVWLGPLPDPETADRAGPPAPMFSDEAILMSETETDDGAVVEPSDNTAGAAGESDAPLKRHRGRPSGPSLKSLLTREFPDGATMEQLIGAGLKGDPTGNLKAGNVTMDPDTEVYRWTAQPDEAAAPETALPERSQPATGEFPPGTKLDLHPLCELFPRINGEGLDELIADIKAHGQREPIVMLEGKVLDGRNRYVALDAAGMPIRYLTFEGDDPAAFVVSMNLHRRHLTESQRGMIAAEFATMRQGQRTDLASAEAKSQTEAAVALNVSRSTVQRAEVVRREGVPELAEAVKQGEVTVAAGVEIAKESPAERTRLLALPAPERKAEVRNLRKPTTPMSPETLRARDASAEVVRSALGKVSSPFKVPPAPTMTHSTPPTSGDDDEGGAATRVSLTNGKQAAIKLIARMDRDQLRILRDAIDAFLDASVLQ